MKTELQRNSGVIEPNVDVLLKDKLISFPKISSWHASSLCAPKISPNSYDQKHKILGREGHGDTLKNAKLDSPIHGFSVEGKRQSINLVKAITILKIYYIQ